MKVYGGVDPRTAQFMVVVEDGKSVASVGPRGWLTFTERKEGELIDPTLVLDMELARELGEVLSKHGLTPKPPDDLTPTKQHLADAIAVRDRLLTIVERS
jgi:hypothetical protein